MRSNKYKKEIVSVLKKNHLLNISGVQKRIGKVDYSTVYRNIVQLVDEKKIKEIVFGKRKVMYEIISPRNQHEHFLCLDCGDIEGVQISTHNIALPAKYKVTDVVVKGLCEKCH